MTTSSAPAQAGGYTYQFQHALLRLFSSQSSDVVVGIETEDDIVTHEYQGSEVHIEFNQSKLSFQDGHTPIGDRSRNLWRSLEIWLKLQRDNISTRTSVSFAFVTNKEVPPSDLVHQLASATSDAEIANAVQQLHALAPTLTGKAKESADNVVQYTQEELSSVVRNLRLLDGAAVAGAGSVAEQTIALFHLTTEMESHAQEIYQALLGDLIDKCLAAWNTKQPALISKRPLAHRLQAEKDWRRRLRLTEQPWVNHDLKEYLSRDRSSLFFLKQIERLEVQEKLWTRAIGHYWGYYAERTRLLGIGDVLPQDFDARDSHLFERWQGTVDNFEISALDDAADIDGAGDGDVAQRKLAREIYMQTIDGKYCAPLGDQSTQHHYFTSGNYHYLANRPNTPTFVYWHKAFKPEDDS